MAPAFFLPFDLGQKLDSFGWKICDEEKVLCLSDEDPLIQR